MVTKHSVLESKIEETKELLKRLEMEYRILQNNDRWSRIESYEKSKKAAEERAERSKALLKVGDLVKVTGTKSISKYRKILSMTDTSIKGLHYRYNKRNKEFVPGDYITDHIRTKVTHVYVNGEFVKI